jgi:hypothetical protein
MLPSPGSRPRGVDMLHVSLIFSLRVSGDSDLRHQIQGLLFIDLRPTALPWRLNRTYVYRKSVMTEYHQLTDMSISPVAVKGP